MCDRLLLFVLDWAFFVLNFRGKKKKKKTKYSLVLSSLKKESKENKGLEMSNWMGIS